MTKHWLTLKNLQQRSSADLVQSQTEWLSSCLQRNQATRFGQHYNFADIKTIQSYQERVPLHRHEDFKPYIARMADGEADVLFKGEVIAFEQTGGSSGGSKLVPYSDSSLKDFQTAMLPWLGNLVTTHQINSGTIYLSLSPATRKATKTASGHSIGLPDAAFLGPVAGQTLMSLSATPTWVGEILDVEQWQLATLYWLVRQQPLSLISLWSPSFFLQLLQGVEHHYSELMELLNRGGQIAGHPLPSDRPAMRRLHQYQQERDSRHLWPWLKVVSCWMDGSSRAFADALKQRLPQASFQAKGLLATEGVTTVPNHNGAPLLAAQSGFFEFLRESGECCLAWELEDHQAYEVVLTTAGGLYRYRTGDQVLFTGMVDGLPELHFLGRSDLTSDLVGEKLSEAFVAHCLEGLPGFHMLAPVHWPEAHYTLVTSDVDGVSSKLGVIEKRLLSNPQYAYARKLGQLGPLTATTHPDPLQAFTAQASMQQRLGDVKVPALLPPTMEIDIFQEDLI